MSNYLALSSLAMDLNRVANGFYRGSTLMAERFYQEALKRESEINTDLTKPYLKKLLDDIKNLSKTKDPHQKAEKALMISILISNAAIAQHPK